MINLLLFISLLPGVGCNIEPPHPIQHIGAIVAARQEPEFFKNYMPSATYYYISGEIYAYRHCLTILKDYEASRKQNIK